MLDVFNAVSKGIIHENMVLNLIMLPIILKVLKNVSRFALKVHRFRRFIACWIQSLLPKPQLHGKQHAN